MYVSAFVVSLCEMHGGTAHLLPHRPPTDTFPPPIAPNLFCYCGKTTNSESCNPIPETSAISPSAGQLSREGPGLQQSHLHCILDNMPLPMFSLIKTAILGLHSTKLAAMFLGLEKLSFKGKKFKLNKNHRFKLIE